MDINKEKLLQACTEIVTVNGRPLSIFHDTGFRKILDLLTSAIGEGTYIIKYNLITFLNDVTTDISGFKVNSHNIKNQILSSSHSVINQIKNDVKNNLISLKIDCVKRHNRSIMGVNTQYIKDDKICLATLAMTEVLVQHTSENLRILVCFSINYFY